MRRLPAIAAAVAVAAGGSFGATVAAGAGTSPAGSVTTHAAKRTKAARCAALQRIAKGRTPAARRSAAARRAAARRARKLGCRKVATKRPQAQLPVTRPGQPQPPARAPTAADATPSGSTAPGGPEIGAAPPPPLPPAAPPPPPPPGPVVSTLGVGAYDMGGFQLRLTRTSVAAGNLTVFFRNYDVSDHNLWIEGPGGDVVERISDTVGEGGGAARTLPVTAGSWRLFCSLPDHGAMTQTLTVTS